MAVTGGRVEGTREAILGILRRSDGVSVDGLARELGLAGATVRRHLDVLLRDGHVSVKQVRGGAGRPRHAFSLTDAGAELFPHHYVRLTHRLLEEIVGLATEETAGRDGAAVADLVFNKMADRLASEYAGRVAGGPLEDRVRSTVALLAEEGIEFEVERTGDSMRLVGRGCPCRRFSNGGGGPFCEHDRRLLELLVDAPVSALRPDELPNQALCGYRVGP